MNAAQIKATMSSSTFAGPSTPRPAAAAAATNQGRTTRSSAAKKNASKYTHIVTFVSDDDGLLRESRTGADEDRPVSR